MTCLLNVKIFRCKNLLTFVVSNTRVYFLNDQCFYTHIQKRILQKKYDYFHITAFITFFAKGYFSRHLTLFRHLQNLLFITLFIVKTSALVFKFRSLIIFTLEI